MEAVPCFDEVRALLTDHGLTFRLYHVAASSATLDFPEMHLDMVRCICLWLLPIASCQTQRRASACYGAGHPSCACSTGPQGRRS